MQSFCRILIAIFVLVTNGAGAALSAPLPDASMTGTTPAHDNAHLLITLNKDGNVSGPRVYLSDIANCSGDAVRCGEISGIDVGPSPLSGRSGIVGKSQIVHILRNEWPENITDVEGPDTVRVIANTAEVRLDDIKLKMQAWINDQMSSLQGVKLTVTRVSVSSGSGVRPSQSSVDFPDMEGLPLKNMDWLSRNMAGVRMMQFRFTNPRDKEDSQTAYGQAVFMLERYIPTAANPVSPGAIIEAKDIVMDWLQLRRGPFEFVDRSDLVVGRKVRQMVLAGEAFSIRQLEMPMVVGRNQGVTMIMRHGDVEITGRAQTIDAGGIGQVVEVVNIANKKRLRAKVIDHQTVEAVAF